MPSSGHGLNPEEYTIADHLKTLGYATACIGKWHLGHHPETLPMRHGFDSYYGIPYSNDMNHPDERGKSLKKLRNDELWKNPNSTLDAWNVPLIRGEKIIELPVDQRTITQRYTDEAITFIEDNKNKPFFYVLPHHIPHVPLYVPDEQHDPDPHKAYPQVIAHLDAKLWDGSAVNFIRQNKLADNTIVIYTSDNGAWLKYKHHAGKQRTTPLTASSDTFEGGHRVPFMALGSRPRPNRHDHAMRCSQPWTSCQPLRRSPTRNYLNNLIIDGVDGSELLLKDPKQAGHSQQNFSTTAKTAISMAFDKDNWKLLMPDPKAKKTKKSAKLPKVAAL